MRNIAAKAIAAPDRGQLQRVQRVTTRVSSSLTMQGGCAALEDAVVLAQCLKAAWGQSDDLGAALADYEKWRAKRCLPLAVRSKGMGVILQSSWPPVVLARDTVVSQLLDPGHFFDHTLFDVGSL
jgi:2-polyprenyl-6-methoxyphenol hydroxylase-like FAD-dependent oxidoreductase